jgi:hypothetical protein
MDPKGFNMGEESKGVYSRVFSKARKTQHQNPEFGPTPGDIHKKKTCKKVD